MTFIPLVVSLLITGIAKTVDSPRRERVAMRPVVTFIALLWISTAMAALLIPALLGFFPMPADAPRSLTGRLTTLAHDAAPHVRLPVSLPTSDTDHPVSDPSNAPLFLPLPFHA